MLGVFGSGDEGRLEKGPTCLEDCSEGWSFSVTILWEEVIEGIVGLAEVVVVFCCFGSGASFLLGIGEFVHGVFHVFVYRDWK